MFAHINKGFGPCNRISNVLSAFLLSLITNRQLLFNPEGNPPPKDYDFKSAAAQEPLFSAGYFEVFGKLNVQTNVDVVKPNYILKNFEQLKVVQANGGTAVWYSDMDKIKLENFFNLLRHGLVFFVG